MIFDAAEDTDTNASLQDAKIGAQQLATQSKGRALISTVAFVISCGSLYPFLEGHALHGYWNSIGKYLLVLSMALLIPFVVSVGVAINMWMYRRNLDKIKV